MNKAINGFAGAIVLAALAVAAPAAPQASDTLSGVAKAASSRIVFTKEFPGSAPAYYSVAVSEDGTSVYSTAPDDPQPVLFRLGESLTKQIFETATKLNNFKDQQLETRRKVAAMGRKTLRYESARERHETFFNYSENADAAMLAGIFERISTTEQHLLNLERTVRFDRLGVLKQLLQIEMSLNKNDLIEPGQFVPLLEKVAGNSSFMHIARERANGLLARIRGNPPE